MDRIKDWAELRTELAGKAGDGAARELERLLAADRKIQAIQLLQDHGISPVDPDRPVSPVDAGP